MPRKEVGVGWSLARAAWCLVALLVVVLAGATLFQEARLILGPRPVLCHAYPSACNVGQSDLPRWVLASLLYLWVLSVVLVLIYLVVAAVLVWRKVEDHMALLAAFCLTLMACTFCYLLPRSALWGGLIFRVSYAGVGLLFIFYYLFPMGPLRPWWVSCLAVISTIYWGIYALFPSLLLNSLDIWVERALLASLVVVQWYRYQRISNLEQRRQTKWVVLGACSSALLVLAQQLYAWLAEPSMMRLPLNELVLQTLFFVALLFIPLSLGIAILRSRLWNIDLIIHRTLVYGVLSACVVGLYVLVVGGLGTLLQTQKNVLVSLLAIGLIATLVQPLRWRLQQAVNYLVYGRRYDPYHVLTRLRQRLEATLAPGEVLPVIVETVAAAFKLPYTAIRLQQEEPSALNAAYGVPPPEETLLHLPLSYQGEEQGELVLAQDSTGQPFSKHDKLLLEDLAHHASIAVHSLRLNADIQHSRERLVIAREEERRRLRRDLHDGLGPQLASLLLQLTTVRKLLRRDPQVAEDRLTRAMTHMQEAISDIRRLVYDLRPPALDDLGLLAALREHMQRYDACGIIFTLTAPECLPALPAAVEVACYRIAQEALTNVITHAQARHCHLSLRIGADLELEVSDDGRGLPATQKPGVGLTTMHERARELGGTCSITTQPQRGTWVHVRLPLDEHLKKATQA